MTELNIEMLSSDLSEKLTSLDNEIVSFRESGELDGIALEKLREHFKASHIYHSAGIEGNRLTLKETMIVLKEGITISEKPIKESVEVKNLGLAYDFLFELTQEDVPITENYLKQIHKLIVGGDEYLQAGNYRNIGVIITGSEHTPPEPFEVPFRVTDLIIWIQDNYDQNPILLSAIAHHELAKVHPFVDGNGRTARLLMNLILMKKGYPICSIKREDRPKYYEAMSSADNGDFEPLVELVAQSCQDLFAQYVRIKEESSRVTEWAQKWGKKDIQTKLRKEKGSFELWNNKMKQIKLEFRQAVVVLNETLENYELSFYEYSDLTFDKYQSLRESGSANNTNSFSVRIYDIAQNRILHTFMFRFFRNNYRYPNGSNVIPLELNYFSPSEKKFLVISSFDWAERISLRAFYFDQQGTLVTRYHESPQWDKEEKGEELTNVVQKFFDEVLSNILGLE